MIANLSLITYRHNSFKLDKINLRYWLNIDWETYEWHERTTKTGKHMLDDFFAVPFLIICWLFLKFKIVLKSAKIFEKIII